MSPRTQWLTEWQAEVMLFFLSAFHALFALCVKVLCFSLVSCKSGAFSQALRINLERNYSVLFGYKGH